jgi:hypothetical protein
LCAQICGGHIVLHRHAWAEPDRPVREAGVGRRAEVARAAAKAYQTAGGGQQQQEEEEEEEEEKQEKQEEEDEVAAGAKHLHKMAPRIRNQEISHPRRQAMTHLERTTRRSKCIQDG